MSDVPPANGPPSPRAPFPAVRLLYAIGFALVAWVVFWVVLLLALMQFVIVALQGRANSEVKNLSLNLIQYLWELLAFVAFVRDEQPFPVGPFPQANTTSA